LTGFLFWLGVLFLLYQKGNSLEVLPVEERSVPPVCTVLVASVDVAPEHREIRFFGVTRSTQQAVISPLVGGKLQSRSVSVGDFVRAGEEIARMDSREGAVQERLRLILLTTGTTVAGLFPLVFSSSNLWSPLAWAMISELAASTGLKLFVIPAMYRVLYPEKGMFSRIKDFGGHLFSRRNVSGEARM